jgi:uncharacterized protein YcnI
MTRNWRTALVALGGALAGMIALAAPAAADVSVSPTAAIKGDSAELAFQVPEDRPGTYTTKVELVAPREAPIAEIYPLSTNDWAPTTTTRKLDRAVELIHGSETTEVVDTVTWTRAPDVAPTGQPAQLRVALGPMPQTDRVAFTVVQTYSDGAVVRWGGAPAADGSTSGKPGPVVALLNDSPTDGTAGDGSQADPAAPDGGSGETPYLIFGVGLLLSLAAEAWLIVRAGRRTALRH